MTKRWRVSDIVRAANGKEDGDFVKYAFGLYKWSLAQALDNLNVTMPAACGVEERAWWRMTHEERCDALVATAKRLNVPRRA